MAFHSNTLGALSSRAKCNFVTLRSEDAAISCASRSAMCSFAVKDGHTATDCQSESDW